MQEVEIVMMSTNSLVPYENNPRSNENAVQYVANSIEQFGFKVPIVVDKNNVIIAGHTRYLAAKKLGMSAVPVIVANDLTEEQVKAFRVADNKTAEQSDWNMLKLSKEILDIDLDLTGFGFSDIEIDNLESLGSDFFGAVEPQDVQEYSPNVYKPNTAPSESRTVINDDQIAKAKMREEQKFSSQYVSTRRTVICPHCYEEFEID